MKRKNTDDGLFGGTHLRQYAERMRSTASEPRFTMGPVKRGMTCGQFLSAAKRAEDVRAMKGGLLGVLTAGPNCFNACFRGVSDTAPAYRVTYRRMFTDRAENEVNAYLGDL
ncbi:MAG: hypothetical protein VW268_14235 [Rhodospirillaceae bacterium]